MNLKFIVTAIILMISLLALIFNVDALQNQSAPILSSGEWILFSRGSGHNTSDTELYAVRPDGSDLIQITDNSYSDWQPRISPDGTKLAYCRYPTIGQAYLYIMDIKTGEDELIFDALFCGDSYYWLADNNRIIYQGGNQAKIIDINTKEVTIIGGTTPIVRHPSISPDMLEIAYSGEPWALYVQSVDGNGSDRHTLPGSNPRGATWNPEGTWIAFESYISGLHVTKTDGSSLKYFGSGYAPTWSPDGTQIAYHNLSGGKIFAVNIDSNGNASGHRTVVSLGGWIAYVSWGSVGVMEDNSLPIADAGGAYNGGEGVAISLDGSASIDPDGDMLSYSWAVDTGLCSFDDPTSVSPNLTCTDNGSFTVTLTVDDGQESDSAEAIVTIDNVAPTAVFNAPLSITEGSDINLSLTDVYDPSLVDTAAGFEFAFDCGDGGGYGVFSSFSSAICPTTDNGSPLVKAKIRDKDGGETEYQSTVTVTNVAPMAVFNAPLSITEGSDINLSLTDVYDPSSVDTAAGFEFAFDCGDGGGYGIFSSFSSAICPTTDNGSPLVKAKVRDKDGGETEYQSTVTVTNVAPTVGPITVSTTLLPVETPIVASADFTDPGTADTHTALWDWGDGITNLGTVTQGAGFGTVSDTHTYTAAGVYTITLTVMDDDGDDNSSTSEHIVVFNPDGGFVTGGGWIDSQAGAFLPDPTLAGKATFGFVSKYKKGAVVPTGNTEFHIQVADFNFHSSSYDWLVVTGGDFARFKGVGTINGMGEYKFIIWAGDGDPDTFRIKIWEEDELGTEIVIYDNGVEQEIGGGSIVVHTGK